MNPTLAAIPGSLIRALNAQKRPGDIDLGLGEPLLRPDVAWFEAATEWVREFGCPYSANAGMLELRTKLATHFAYPGLDRPENVCVTVGSQEALYLAIKALCDPATDEVLIVSPCYPAYPKLCQLEGVAHREVLLDPERGFEPDADRVLAAIGPQTRLVLLASPANPTGRVWPRAELEKLAAGLGEVAVLVDEVYRELDYSDQAPFSIATVHPHTFVANSLSKSHALTGLRLGWLMGPAEPMQAVVKAHQFVNTAASTFSQRVALAALDAPSHRAHYMAQRARLLQLLDAAGLAYVAPDGAFYCMLRIGGDSVKAAFALLEQERVVTIPGVAFGAEGWLRISWVAPEEALAEGIGRIARFLQC
ncbi:MAG: Aspartate transaminase [Cyanobacteria bacterium RYN_339]|nr:Aspartate transaminase [Cyanobacteria bacterium RYN_339]